MLPFVLISFVAANRTPVRASTPPAYILKDLLKKELITMMRLYYIERRLSNSI
jgi:hypothetical protein